MDPNAETQTVYLGRLGRTSKTSVLISSASGPVFPATIYTSVDVTEDPELQEMLLEGGLNQIECPFEQGRRYDLAIPVRYHDSERRFFALFIPEQLRHEEFKHRSDLLQELSKEREVLPDYVRHFSTVFSAQELLDLAKGLECGGASESLLDVIGDLEEEEAQVITLPLTAVKSSGEFEALRAKIAQERQVFEAERAQVAEVAERLERERERMEEVEMGIVSDRMNLDRERAKLNAASVALEQERVQVQMMRLHVEQEQLRLAQGDEPASGEQTQVVTEDQFIEIVSAKDEEVDVYEPVQLTHVHGLCDVGVLATFDEDLASGRDLYVQLVQGRAVASCKATSHAVDNFLKQGPKLYLQYHVMERYPLVSVLLACLNDEQQLKDSFAWPLDVCVEAQRAFIQALGRESSVCFAFYDHEGKLLRTWDVAADLESNVPWILSRADDFLTSQVQPIGTFKEASTAYLMSDFERLGTMRHHFSFESFDDVDTPSKAKLAAGIVGYWSGADTFDYLIGNRSFPLHVFEQIQHRVVGQALGYGIYLNQELRDFAVMHGLVGDHKALTRRMLANYAELSVGLKDNDLDPLERWENWDALFSLSDELDVQPPLEIVELASASFRQAKDFQEGISSEPVALLEEEAEVEEHTVISTKPFVYTHDGDAHDEVPKELFFPNSDSFHELVIARRSESTGITYFLPDDAVLGQFEKLEDLSKEELLLLLQDATGRLEAAQMLIERFGHEVVLNVLDASEEMNAPEIAALARFFEDRADGLEGELVQCVESGGPSATYIASHALMTMRSTLAIPTLLEALRDPRRQGNRYALAKTLSGYGSDKLLPFMLRTIKRVGHDDALIDVLVALEGKESGTLTRLARDRHRKVREAAKQAKMRVTLVS